MYIPEYVTVYMADTSRPRAGNSLSTSHLAHLNTCTVHVHVHTVNTQKYNGMYMYILQCTLYVHVQCMHECMYIICTCIGIYMYMYLLADILMTFDL